MSALLRPTVLASRRLALPAASRTLASKATKSKKTPAHPPSAPPTPAKGGPPAVAAEPPTDATTSAYSPSHTVIPEEHIPADVIPAGAVSGAPLDLQSRTVRIYKPTKNAMQSSNHRGGLWRMDWDVMAKGHRWENPLMGWQSSADYLQGTHLKFRTKEDAIYFAEKQGYDYSVQEPKERVIVSKAYASNFSWSDKKLKKIHTK
ncbi:NADH:ubiquinone oxidoreductase 21kD subunit [Orbilia oligospora]|uniref:NADH dehydrogenase [ubiquinone] iron-sulfur protein 4, mitochondrial n=1 Tax=Orbilia oligospora TaxID=2813651 RepID=A0A7C8KCB7_ORBOL|nr:NADH:ubiquinone oxidoreductase 21kD subunit [Orbilia oligospora]KAF3175802.1 NADH:ubiquinone oxidoreductase 21kD subunit [Orbilia oligospora]KAF3236061.1 NADH:ubiquinone oxidoreductase 21kD subunit [Orbilia oligospora]KAF3243138.1 NADH:ubiquinone oxidoreductase 21kD subunit [Orbilia oligospora]KAF3294794.1 NADH:ubiquinone oxidoreductase 21kD subunit [Orbilia oligospora]